MQNPERESTIRIIMSESPPLVKPPDSVDVANERIKKTFSPKLAEEVIKVTASVDDQVTDDLSTNPEGEEFDPPTA